MYLIKDGYAQTRLCFCVFVVQRLRVYLIKDGYAHTRLCFCVLVVQRVSITQRSRVYLIKDGYAHTRLCFCVLVVQRVSITQRSRVYLIKDGYAHTRLCFCVLVVQRLSITQCISSRTDLIRHVYAFVSWLFNVSASECISSRTDLLRHVYNFVSWLFIVSASHRLYLIKDGSAQTRLQFCVLVVHRLGITQTVSHQGRICSDTFTPLCVSYSTTQHHVKCISRTDLLKQRLRFHLLKPSLSY